MHGTIGTRSDRFEKYSVSCRIRVPSTPQHIDIHTLRRYPSTHVRSKRNPFSRVKMFNACREKFITRGGVNVSLPSSSSPRLAWASKVNEEEERTNESLKKSIN